MIDDIRSMLRAREALLVHFNTPASRHPIGYPDDLHDALANPAWRMCYSTILLGDLPSNLADDPTKAAAFGSVGIVVDLAPSTVIERVFHSDGGSDGRTHNQALGALASRQACEDSIVNRTAGHNEWLIGGADPLGIFLFPSPSVFIRARGGDGPYDSSRVIGDFPSQRVFSTQDGIWIEYDRAAGHWVRRHYDDIIVP